MKQEQIRQPAVAGRFYPESAVQLRRLIEVFLAAGRRTAAVPKALIAPHAGYRYSGPIAGSAYTHLANLHRPVKRVILLGPAHFIPVRGAALSPAIGFATPLGTVAVDRETCAELEKLPEVVVSETPHEPEHSLEVQLPFLQVCCPRARIVPLLIGQEEAATAVLETVWGNEETLIVISSDLSHYFAGDHARRLDGETAREIEALRPVEPAQACGFAAINGFLQEASCQGVSLTVVDLRHSGDTAGMDERVVGYGAFVGEEAEN